jgi:hypothetical protein
VSTTIERGRRWRAFTYAALLVFWALVLGGVIAGQSGAWWCVLVGIVWSLLIAYVERMWRKLLAEVAAVDAEQAALDADWADLRADQRAREWRPHATPGAPQ